MALDFSEKIWIMVSGNNLLGIGCEVQSNLQFTDRRQYSSGVVSVHALDDLHATERPLHNSGNW